MPTVGVYGCRPEDGVIKNLNSLGLNDIQWSEPCPEMRVLLILPDVAKGTKLPNLCHSNDLDVVAAPTGLKGLPSAKSLVTYGLGAKESITYSSLSPDNSVIALQREVVTINGTRLERQEIPTPPTEQPEKMLAMAAAMLIAGCTAESLSNNLKSFVLPL